MVELLARQPEYSPEDLSLLPGSGHRELISGRLVEKETGARSAWIGGERLRRLHEFARASGHGPVFPADVGKVCFPKDPKKVRWSGVLRGDDVLPGFECCLSELFPPEDPGGV